MRRYLVLLSVALAVLLLFTGCLAPQKENAAVTKILSGLKVEESDGQLVVSADTALAGVEFRFKGDVAASIDIPEGYLVIKKLVGDETVVALVKPGGEVIKEGELLLKAPAGVEFTVKVAPFTRKFSKEEELPDYENDPDAHILGDSYDKEGNMDSMVDIYDFVRFVKAYGSKKGDEGYREELDLTSGTLTPEATVYYTTLNGKKIYVKSEEDDEINFADFYVFAANYMKNGDRDPIVEVYVGGEKITHSLYKDPGTYEVRVKVTDYDKNRITVVFDSIEFTGTAGEFDKVVGYITLGSDENSKDFTVKVNDHDHPYTLYLNQIRIKWSGSTNNNILTGTTDSYSVEGTIYWGPISFSDDVEKYNFGIKVENVNDPKESWQATRAEITSPAHYVSITIKQNQAVMKILDEYDNVLDMVTLPIDLKAANKYKIIANIVVYYFNQVSSLFGGDYELVETTGNATLVSGKVWFGKNDVHGDHTKLIIKKTVNSTGVNLSEVTFDIGGETKTFRPGDWVVDPNGAIKEIDGYYYIDKPATFIFDLTSVVNGWDTEEKSASITVDSTTDDIGDNKYIDNADVVKVEGKDTIYFDSKAPRMIDLPEISNTPNEKVIVEFIKQSNNAFAFKDLVNVYATALIYLEGEETPAASEGFGLFDPSASTYGVAMSYSDYDALKSIDKTYFTLKIEWEDEFGNKAVTIPYEERKLSGELYVDTLFSVESSELTLEGIVDGYTRKLATVTILFDDKSGLDTDEATAEVEFGNGAVATPVNVTVESGRYVVEFEFDDIADTDGTPATLTIEATDLEGNSIKHSWTILVDNLAATVATWNGNVITEQDVGISTRTYTSGNENIPNPVTLEFSTENIYDIDIEAYVAGTDYEDNPYKPDLSALEYTATSIVLDFQKLGIIADAENATVVVTITDKAENVSKFYAVWSDTNTLSTAKRGIMVGWKVEDLVEYNPDLIIDYTPKIADSGKDWNEKEADLTGHVDVVNGKVKFTVYATTTNSDYQILLYDGTTPWVQDNASVSNIYSAYLDYNTDESQATIDIYLDTDKNVNIDLQGSLTLQLMSADGGLVGDELGSVATVTFEMPDFVEPAAEQFDATIVIGGISGQATLVLEVTDLDVLKFFEGATFVGDPVVSIWDTSDYSAPVETIGPASVTRDGSFTFEISLTKGKYAEDKNYEVRIPIKGIRYYYKGAVDWDWTTDEATGLFETNDHMIEGILTGNPVTIEE